MSLASTRMSTNGSENPEMQRVTVACRVFGPGDERQGLFYTTEFSRVPMIGEYFTLPHNEENLHYRCIAVTHIGDRSPVAAEIRGIAEFPADQDRKILADWEAIKGDVQKRWHDQKEGLAF